MTVLKLNKVPVYSRFGPRIDASDVVFKKPSRTKLSDAKHTDINDIIAKWQKVNGEEDVNRALQMLGVEARASGQWGVDASIVPEFQEAQNVLVRAMASFEAIPAKLRKRFDNDPAQFLQFVSDPDNSDELVKLGLRIPKAEPEIKAAEPPVKSAGAKAPAQGKADSKEPAKGQNSAPDE